MSPVGTGAATPFDDGLSELITGLDEQDRPYPIKKLLAHQSSVRHLAISVFLLRGGKLLLQQRAATKYHAPLLWANSACSHPRWGESSDSCATRTLRRELGQVVPVQFFMRTHYEAAVGHLFENEVVDCYRGEITPDFSFDTIDHREIARLRLASLDEIENGVRAQPDLYAPWFRIYVESGIVADILGG